MDLEFAFDLGALEQEKILSLILKRQSVRGLSAVHSHEEKEVIEEQHPQYCNIVERLGRPKVHLRTLVRVIADDEL